MSEILAANDSECFEMESDFRIDNPHSLMYLAGMACSKKFQLLHRLEDCDVEDSFHSSNNDIDLVCGRLDFMKDDFFEPSRSEDTFDEEIDEDICPDSPGLIASMRRDLQNLNLSQSPNSSDADIARRIDSFLRDAMKPLDDFLCSRNDTSEDDLSVDDKENVGSQRDARAPAYTLYSSPSAASTDYKYSTEEGGEEEECSVLNQSFTTEDSEINQSIKEALEEIEGVCPVMLDHQLQETGLLSDEDYSDNDNAEEEEDDDNNTNNNFYSTDSNDNARIGSYYRISERFPTFSLMSPVNESNDMLTMQGRAEDQADSSLVGYDLQPSKSDTRSLDTTGSDKFYTDVDTSTDTAKFYTDRDTDLDNTMEDGSVEGVRWKSPSPSSPASDGQEVTDWGMEDSVIV
jgi:hypothetical protein